jgi:hypothetical protein
VNASRWKTSPSSSTLPARSTRSTSSRWCTPTARWPSLIGTAAIAGLEAGMGIPLDHRRFRANVYAEWAGPETEDAFLGRRVRLGDQAILYFLERDPRCKMISLDPDTGAHDPRVLRYVAQQRGGYVGIYAAVLVEGIVKQGDSITVLDG